ncbi:MAG: hypothetical protein ACRDHW_12290, partial [Ktedonobacteraceae bacterium]
MFEQQNIIYPIIIEYGDDFGPVTSQEHTLARPFCWDMTCPCHRDLAALARVAWAHHEGLCTAEEAGRIIAGKQF